MSADKEIDYENKTLERELQELQRQLAENKKDIKYQIGLTIGENTRPRNRIPSIPGKIRLLKKEYREGLSQPSGPEPEEDALAYRKALQDRIRKLNFYNNLNHSDILYAIGEEVFDAGHSVIRWMKLPFRLWRIHRANKRLVTMDVAALPPIEGLNDCVLFIATNGAGLGHLTRCLAVARMLKRKSENTEIIFLTTSLALTAVQREGFTAYCIPSLMLIKNMSSGQWNAMLKTMMTELLQLYQFSAVIFDGAMPYASITAAMAGQKQIPRIWMRRGSEKNSDLVEKRNEAEKDFDFVIIPAEAGAALPEPDEKHYYVNPVIFLNREELWSREEVRRYLKIPEGKLAVYVQMGAGNINDIDSDISKIVSELRKYKDIMIVLGESIIGNELRIIEDDIIIIKDYPNSKYFNGFDFAVSACGYNSFHELLYFGVPTIYIPNMNTKTDDQYARAMIAQNNHAGIVVTGIGDSRLADAVSFLHDASNNQQMREQAGKFMTSNGSGEAADFILKHKRDAG